MQRWKLRIPTVFREMLVGGGAERMTDTARGVKFQTAIKMKKVENTD